MRMILGVSFIAAVTVLNSYAGLVVTSETTTFGSAGKSVQKATMIASPDMVRMNTEGQPNYAIFRGDKQEFWLVDEPSRIYTVMDQKMADAVGAQMQAATQGMEAGLSKMRPGQRMLAERMMKRRTGAPGATQPAQAASVETKNSGEEKEINGRSCTRYDVLTDGKKTGELWVAPWNSVGIGESDCEVFRKMSIFMQGITSKLATGPLPDLNRAPFSGYEDVKGFPVLIRGFNGNTLTYETTFTTIKKSDAAASEFDIPAGFERRGMPAIPPAQ